MKNYKNIAAATLLSLFVLPASAATDNITSTVYETTLQVGDYFYVNVGYETNGETIIWAQPYCGESLCSSRKITASAPVIPGSGTKKVGFTLNEPDEVTSIIISFERDGEPVYEQSQDIKLTYAY